jgi:hypothetical protein
LAFFDAYIAAGTPKRRKLALHSVPPKFAAAYGKLEEQVRRSKLRPMHASSVARRVGGRRLSGRILSGR